MSRSSWKGYHIDNSIYKYISKKKKKEIKKSQQENYIIKIWSRRSTILKAFVGKIVWIHNGKVFLKKRITDDMIGHKFGEFAFTRKNYKFKRSKKK